MQCMTRAYSKAIINKLLVFGEYCSFYNPVATISIIIKQRVTYMLHVYTYLVCTTGFKPALNQTHITKFFQYGIMRYCIFAMISFGVYIHYFPETLMAPYMTGDGSFAVFKIAPNQCYIPAVNRMRG